MVPQPCSVSTVTLQIPSTSAALYTIPWDQFPYTLQQACANKQVASSADRRVLVRMVADGLVHKQKDCSRSMCVNVAQRICEKYPKTFQERAGFTIGNGYDILRSQLYTRVNEVNRLKGCKEQAVFKDVDDLSLKRRHSAAKDAYGCVAYYPQDYPEGETAESQERKRLSLIHNTEDEGEERENRIKSLMLQTYVSQRFALVNKYNTKQGIADIIKDWPHLFDKYSLVKHADVLMGFLTKERWENSLVEKGEKIFNFMLGTKGKKKERVEEEVYAAKLASNQQLSKMPYYLAVVPLLIKYFEDEPLFIILPENATDGDILEAVTMPHPTLAIKGTSIYDTTATSVLIVENVICARGSQTLHGFLLVFLSYFIFNISYPATSCSTLEFMQRSMMKINPLIGTKRGGKRKKTTVAPKVAALIKALADKDACTEDDCEPIGSNN